MKEKRSYIRVAVAGPPLRTFTYHIDESMLPLQLGQRLVVPFGRMRTIGFYLGETEFPEGIRTKRVVEALDGRSLFSDELFKLCLWMSEYYLANPADCLSAALPSLFKSRHSVSYRWGDKEPADVPQEVASLFEPGRNLTPGMLATLRSSKGVSLAELIVSGVVEEQFGRKQTKARPEISGYRVLDREGWVGFFARRKFQPEQFDTNKSREELGAEGWTAHYLKAAVGEGLLEPIMKVPSDSVLDFVKPKEGVLLLEPTRAQRDLIEDVASRLDDGFKPFLLHGVTGSGKTLVYCHLASEVLTRGRTVLVLTPEISLSGIALAYFRGFFGDKVTVWHSAMTEREKLTSWTGIRNGDFRIVVGPRSALFAPLDDIGLIIVDEEHDGSYKQDDPSPRFHGRDSAIVRAKMNGIPIVLGSASPSMESYHNAKSGRYQLLQLTDRPGKAELPEITIVDHNRDRIDGAAFFLSYTLKKRLEDCFDTNGQAILFLNRRGFSPRLICRQCQDRPECPSCRIHLTYHSVGQKLVCHYCGHMLLDYTSCRKCGGTDLIFPGAGTQKIESSVVKLFEKARPIRFDSDTASGRQNAHQILQQFASGDYNLLLGTQMVTKGLDMPGVTLVGVLSADHGLHWPDFRASEKVFARLLQVAGRSGRSSRPGEVIIQTVNPDNPVIEDARRQDYLSFFEREICTRRELFYPPFSRLMNVVLSGKEESRTNSAAHKFKEELAAKISRHNLRAEILGPAPCPLYFIRKSFRVHMLVKTDRIVRLTQLVREWEGETPGFGLPSTVKLTIDVDPDDIM